MDTSQDDSVAANRLSTASVTSSIPTSSSPAPGDVSSKRNSTSSTSPTENKKGGRMSEVDSIPQRDLQTPTAAAAETDEDVLPDDVESLKALVVELREMNVLLTKELNALKTAAVKKIPTTLPSSGPKLQHMNKSRVTPRSKVAPRKSQDDAPKPDDNQATNEVEVRSSPTKESPAEQSEPEPVVDPEEKKRRLIAQMGGVNIMQMGPINVGMLKSSRAAMSRSMSGDVSAEEKKPGEDAAASPTHAPVAHQQPEVDEAEIRKWMAGVLGDSNIEDTKVPLSTLLRDGQILCRLISALRPQSPLKVNTGRFSFMHMENINNYIKASQQLGARLSFGPVDLYDGSDMKKVLENLDSLKKAVGK